ncbi:beta-1,4-xyloglucan hydrolase [Achromobacter phage Motura]|uniref:Beta-1,4-xyloglucan hydrolase n=1 Tax=Achromobacter phage Motura TaxID=2591403 RepID=A0A514CT34_9CAUD|nr:beta-1,4-xyloglucan hydrolase [Achromobacter phage Motura]QDH83633.1 beta-1,4-xyloglucan hydrolase [Achromobacter phage Motura]
MTTCSSLEQECPTHDCRHQACHHPYSKRLNMIPGITASGGAQSVWKSIPNSTFPGTPPVVWNNALSGNGGDDVFVGGYTTTATPGVYQGYTAYSADGGDTWSELTPPLPNGYLLNTSINLTGTKYLGVFYTGVAGDVSKYYLTEDSGQTWGTAIDTGFSNGCSYCVEPSDPNRVYVTGPQVLRISTNGMATMPTANVVTITGTRSFRQVVADGKGNVYANIVFNGSPQRGEYIYSTNFGASWSAIQTLQVQGKTGTPIAHNFFYAGDYTGVDTWVGYAGSAPGDLTYAIYSHNMTTWFPINLNSAGSRGAAGPDGVVMMLGFPANTPMATRTVWPTWQYYKLPPNPPTILSYLAATTKYWIAGSSAGWYRTPLASINPP